MIDAGMQTATFVNLGYMKGMDLACVCMSRPTTYVQCAQKRGKFLFGTVLIF